MRKAIVAAIAAGLMISAPPAQSAPTVAQRRELAAIRREVLKAPALLRRRKYDQAGKTLLDAEKRLKKLLDGAKFPANDRAVAALKRLIRIQKARLQRANPQPKSGGTPRKSGKPDFAALLARKRQAERKAERDRLESDLAYWARKIRSGPARSPAPTAAEREQALFHVGLLNLKLRRPRPAAESFERLLEKYPHGRYAVAARCRLFDLQLEQFLDLPAAEAQLQASQPWTEKTAPAFFLKVTKADVKPPSKLSRPARPDLAGPPLPPLKLDKKKIAADRAAIKQRTPKKHAASKDAKMPPVPSFVEGPYTDLEDLAAVYRRRGIVEFIKGRHAYARLPLYRAYALHGPPVKRQTPDDFIEQYVYAATMSHHLITSLELWKSRKPVFPYLCYADLLYLSRDFERSRDYAAKLLGGKPHQFSDLQRSYLYALRGRSLNGVPDAKEREKAVADFLAAIKLAPHSKWADECLFLAANARWNHQHQADQAIALYRRLLKEYPQSRRADRSAYYIGVLYEQGKRYKLAKAAYESLLETSPQSAYVKLTKKHLKQVEKELSRPSSR